MKTNSQSMIAGLALLFSMGMANATTTNLSDLTSYGDAGYSSPVITHLGVSSFTDIYNFTLPTLSDVGAGVANISFSVGSKSYNIPNLTLTLKDGFNNIGTTLSSGATFGGLTLGGGSYSFMVAGTPVGTGGKYVFNAVAAPVPEPQTWAMMLGGLGLIGFMSFRRRKYS